MNNNIMDLKFFFESEKDFFTNAFNEAYNIGVEEDNSNVPSEPVESPESVSEGEQVEEPATEVETPSEPSKEQTKEIINEIKRVLAPGGYLIGRINSANETM